MVLMGRGLGYGFTSVGRRQRLRLADSRMGAPAGERLPYDVQPARFARQVLGMFLAVQSTIDLFTTHSTLSELIGPDPSDDLKRRSAGLDIAPLHLYLSVYNANWKYLNQPMLTVETSLDRDGRLLPALGEFYTRVLGEPGFRDGTWFGWDDGAQLVIGGHSEVKGRNSLPQRVMLTVEVADLPGAFEKVKAAGGVVVAEPYKPDGDGDNWLATLEDPDGNFIQLSTPWQG
jgi:predicted enzyme related to lactoylglutathione lyase